MKNLLFLFLVFFKLSLGFGQTPVLDSLKQEFAKAKSDTAKVLLYEKLMKATQGQAAIDYGMKGLALAKRIHYDKGAILCGNWLAFSLVQQNYYKSILILMETKQLCEKNKDSMQLAQTLGYLGYAYGRFDHQKGLQYYFECKKLMEKVNLPQSTIPINTLIGFEYKDAGIPDSALVYLQKGYTYALQSATPFLPPQSFYVHFGEVYYQKGQKELAMSYFRRSIGGQVFLGMANIFRDKNELDSARYYAKKALHIFQEKKMNLHLIQAANLLFELYKNSNAAEALNYLVLATTTKDSLFSQEKGRQIEKLAFEERERAAQNERMIVAREVAFKNRVRLYALLAVLGVVLLIAFILYRNNRQKQVANALLLAQKEEIQSTLNLLKSTQAQLIQSEKLASLGELTAGIAHEIQNPLNFVNNFAEVSAEMLDEMHEELEKGDTTEAIAIAKDLKTNLEKINHHGQRASSIVKGMLEHSRASTGVKEPTDLNALADEYLRLAYHGLRAKDNNFNATMETHFDPDLPLVSVIPQDIGRVLLNLINNAFYAVAERSRSIVGSPLAGAQSYQPTVTISTQKIDDQILIKVQDNGNGIPEAIKDKIFQPFFTTKPTGQGTGLGLSLAYDIVTKGHGGTLMVESIAGEGTAFVLTLTQNPSQP
ncbi:MAG: ATP-binding protein [Haliscomenobacter sp.]|uniref:sensor histidine kinase n=1 Tax=Haliscomenobacter sp. TaxID=2717303 RepID=UPI0029B748BA|nr:ATP-binding protein [Haliscomenobacter sp.]MDX2071817.1 ATP-binding protein [Haliscomenobacter sp.]